jgi:hypothetical protein
VDLTGNDRVEVIQRRYGGAGLVFGLSGRVSYSPGVREKSLAASWVFDRSLVVTASGAAFDPDLTRARSPELCEHGRCGRTPLRYFSQRGIGVLADAA